MEYKKGQLYQIHTEELAGTIRGKYISDYEGYRVFSGKIKFTEDKKIVERQAYTFLRESPFKPTEIIIMTKAQFDMAANSRIRNLENKIKGVKQ